MASFKPKFPMYPRAFAQLHAIDAARERTGSNPEDASQRYRPDREKRPEPKAKTRARKHEPTELVAKGKETAAPSAPSSREPAAPAVATPGSAWRDVLRTANAAAQAGKQEEATAVAKRKTARRVPAAPAPEPAAPPIPMTGSACPERVTDVAETTIEGDGKLIDIVEHMRFCPGSAMTHLYQSGKPRGLRHKVFHLRTAQILIEREIARLGKQQDEGEAGSQ